jgi:hypothetical protein
MIREIVKLVKQAFPGFPDHYAPRLGEVVAIADPLAAERGTDRFRPRYAVDVQPLTPAGEPDPAAPILRGLPLPVTAAGQGRGIYGFPDIGARVLYAFAYGLPSHPQILAMYPHGQAVPAVRPGELLIQPRDGAFLRFDAKGNVTLQTDGELRQDSHLRTVAADEASEAYGRASRTVDGDLVEQIGGRLAQTVLGALLLSVGGDVRTAIVGGEDRTVGGDKSELVGGKLEAAAQQSLTLTANLGALLLESKLGVATLKAALNAALQGATVTAGNGAVELLAILDAVLTALQAETHGTGVGPSTTPLNTADYTGQQTQLGTIKG